MEKDNMTSWTVFILQGVLSQTKSPATVVSLLVTMFLMVLSGNCLLLYLIQVDSGLQSPMYFFLSQLSFMDICQTLTIGPKLTEDFLRKRNVISLSGCSLQIFFIITMALAEFLLLAVMSYDRYVAICRPLQYPILMRRKICLSLTASVWSSATLHALVPTVYILLQPYCGSNVIQHIYCDLPSMLKLSCSDTSAFEKFAFFLSFEMFLPPLSTILVSYSCILITVLQSKGKSHKALGTCFSHLAVVGLFYGAAMFKYMRLKSYRTPFQDDVVSVLCTIDVLKALTKLCRKHDH